MAVLKVICPEQEGEKRAEYRKGYRKAILFRGIVLGLTFLALLFSCILPSNHYSVEIKNADGTANLWEKTYKASPIGTLAYFIEGVSGAASDSGKTEAQILEEKLAQLTEEEKKLDTVAQDVAIIRKNPASAVEKANNITEIVAGIEYSVKIDTLSAKIEYDSLVGLTSIQEVKDELKAKYDKVVAENTIMRYEQAADILNVFAQDAEEKNVKGINTFIYGVQWKATAIAGVESFIGGILGEGESYEETLLTNVAEYIKTEKLAEKYLVGEYEINNEFVKSILDIEVSKNWSSKVCTNPMRTSGDAKYDEFSPYSLYLYERESVDKDNTKVTRSYPSLDAIGMFDINGVLQELFGYLLILVVVITGIKYLVFALNMPNSMKTIGVAAIAMVVPLIGVVMGIAAKPSTFTYLVASMTLSVLNIFGLIFGIAAFVMEKYTNIQLKKLNRELQK